MTKAISYLAFGVIGLALGASAKAIHGSFSSNSESPEASRQSYASGSLLGGEKSDSFIGAEIASTPESVNRIAELEAAFSQTFCDSETTERIVELLREWGEHDVVGLFRWWRTKDFRFIESTMRQTYNHLLHNLTEKDEDFAWEIAQSFKNSVYRFGDLSLHLAAVKARSGTAEEFAQFLDQIDATVDSEALGRSGASLGTFYGIFAMENPKEALRFVQGIQDPWEQAHMISAMNYLNMSVDETLESFPRGATRDEAIQALAREATGNEDIATVSRILQEMENPVTRRKTAENLAKQMLQGLDLEAFERLDESFEVS